MIYSIVLSIFDYILFNVVITVECLMSLHSRIPQYLYVYMSLWKRDLIDCPSGSTVWPEATIFPYAGLSEHIFLN